MIHLAAYTRLHSFSVSAAHFLRLRRPAIWGFFINSFCRRLSIELLNSEPNRTSLPLTICPAWACVSRLLFSYSLVEDGSEGDIQAPAARLIAPLWPPKSFFSSCLA
jgi:hypothetical protein